MFHDKISFQSIETALPAAPPRHLLISLPVNAAHETNQQVVLFTGKFSPTLSEEEDRFPGVHAGERHDVQVRQPSFVRVADG